MLVEYAFELLFGPGDGAKAFFELIVVKCAFDEFVVEGCEVVELGEALLQGVKGIDEAAPHGLNSDAFDVPAFFEFVLYFKLPGTGGCAFAVPERNVEVGLEVLYFGDVCEGHTCVACGTPYKGWACWPLASTRCRPTSLEEQVRSEFKGVSEKKVEGFQPLTVLMTALLLCAMGLVPAYMV